MADLAAPVQGEKGSQTLLGTAKESFPPLDWLDL